MVYTAWIEQIFRKEWPENIDRRDTQSPGNRWLKIPRILGVPRPGSCVPLSVCRATNGCCVRACVCVLCICVYIYVCVCSVCVCSQTDRRLCLIEDQFRPWHWPDAPFWSRELARRPPDLRNVENFLDRERNSHDLSSPEEKGKEKAVGFFAGGGLGWASTIKYINPLGEFVWKGSESQEKVSGGKVRQKTKKEKKGHDYSSSSFSMLWWLFLRSKMKRGRTKATTCCWPTVEHWLWTWPVATAAATAAVVVLAIDHSTHQLDKKRRERKKLGTSVMSFYFFLRSAALLWLTFVREMIISDEKKRNKKSLSGCVGYKGASVQNTWDFGSSFYMCVNEME